MHKNWTIVFVILLGVTFIIAPVWADDYGILTPAELKKMMEDKDFFLMDVHVPEQEHIPGTDAFVDYRDINKIVETIPSDKDAGIVIYCRSGNMSSQVAQELADLGYTNVYHLAGGTNAFNNL